MFTNHNLENVGILTQSLKLYIKEMNHMLRYLIIYIIIILCLFMNAGCYNKADSSQSDSRPDKTTATQASSNLSDSKIYNRVKTLLDHHAECLNIFTFETLPFNDTIIQGKMQKVESEKFHSFGQLKAFVTDTYTKEVVDDLLNNLIEEGYQLYFEQDGVFYINANWGGGYIPVYDWSSYTFRYFDVDSKTKRVSISLNKYVDTSDGPGAGVEPATITVNIVLEDGIWKLNDYFWC